MLWLNTVYSCLLASETDFLNLLRLSWTKVKRYPQAILPTNAWFEIRHTRQFLLILSKKHKSSEHFMPLFVWLRKKKTKKRNLQIPWLPYPLPAPALVPWLCHLQARLGGRILSEGLAQLAAATWMKQLFLGSHLVGDVIVSCRVYYYLYHIQI